MKKHEEWHLHAWEGETFNKQATLRMAELDYGWHFDQSCNLGMAQSSGEVSHEYRRAGLQVLSSA